MLESPDPFENRHGGDVRFPWLICCLAVLAVPAHAELCKTKNLMPEYFAFEAKTAAMTPEQLGRLSALVRSRQRLSNAGNSAARGLFHGGAHG